MSLLRPAPAKSFAVARINRMLGRIYALALVAIATEAIVNAFSGIEHLHPQLLLVSVTVYGLSVLGVALSQILDRRTQLFLRLHAIVALALLISWPLQCDPSMLPLGYQPWIWWTLGMAMVAAGASFSFPVAVTHLIAIPSAWLFLAMSEFGANHNLLEASQEASQLFLFPTTLVAMVLALRWEAGKVDAANQIAIDSAVESARIDAVELERTRLDALVHDSVLTTLLVAAAAESPEQRQVAKKSAEAAIEKLRRAAIGVETQAEMTVSSFFSALTTAIGDSYPGTIVSSERVSDQILPTSVVKAFTEATLQALDNSVKHAQAATTREVRLRGIAGGMKIVVSDDGPGFRLNQVPKDRLGLRNSIMGRVERAGGKVFLNTRPGSGTTLVFEWSVS